MELQANKTERIHSLDSLRAIMMLLGIVIHSAIPYTVTEFGFHKDPNTTHITVDIIFVLIHSFRMPIFMVIAGFFGAMLFYERGIYKMLKNRVTRVVFPFIVFLLLLHPTLQFARLFAKAVFSGSNYPIKEAAAYFTNLLSFLPNVTWHLWFLYYLIYFIITSVIIATVFKRVPKKHTTGFLQISNNIFKKPLLRVFIFAGMTAFVFLIIGTPSIPHSNSFKPSLNVFIFYFSFYMVGWILYKSKEQLNSFKQLDWMCTILALVLFTIGLSIEQSKLIAAPYGNMIKILVQSLEVWLFIFGITGLFIRYASNHSARMRYISDASYWVYLVHYTLTIFIAPLLIGWEVHAITKFVIVIISTTIISFTSYHYLVRSTFIGKFLNGRKYSRKITDTKKEKERKPLHPALDK
ncbi:acyltransferase family protein [Tenacibaculum maritimum]|uniref:acyltransferase family protein n=1 Tax=Tenacibaculum maritimum TaxID=107401 RepID=UPI0012E6A454|nr:acyltransferase family protein [Tenacibaculum maritimum]CAA0189982.1 conserved membrane hypothetical protein [Tenacibaculum maritimum]CAA0189989.1 conserved membrane hypothetical protein [Tenacibaculum maritimum]CAA0217956.1 conserved membrane hypothetical protein [Tenacibaculum maritimum]